MDPVEICTGDDLCVCTQCGTPSRAEEIRTQWGASRLSVRTPGRRKPAPTGRTGFAAIDEFRDLCAERLAERPENPQEAPDA